MLTICISVAFDAAHYIPGHEKCGNVHGHTYRIEVEVTGELEKGMIMDFSDLEAVVRKVIEKYDHNLLNRYLENPTCENMCLKIFEELKEEGLDVVRLRVYETPEKWAELRLK